jgi:hypothetical protein
MSTKSLSSEPHLNQSFKSTSPERDAAKYFDVEDIRDHVESDTKPFKHRDLVREALCASTQLLSFIRRANRTYSVTAAYCLAFATSFSSGWAAARSFSFQFSLDGGIIESVCSAMSAAACCTAARCGSCMLTACASCLAAKAASLAALGPAM